MQTTIERYFRELMPPVDFCSLRMVEERSETIDVRQGVLQPVTDTFDLGVMVMIIDKGGLGYSATCDLTRDGIRKAIEKAKTWAEATQKVMAFDYSKVAMPHPVGEYESPVSQPWEAASLSEKIELLQVQNERLKIHDSIVDWEAGLRYVTQDILYLTSEGGRVEQRLRYMAPKMGVTGHKDGVTQRRSLGINGECQQGGMEVLDRIDFTRRSSSFSEEVLELLDAPNCPSGKMELVLASDQMMLQIHESVGHPLELDRILGDERNYAGTSFVTLDMFGSYRYGSPLMNITFDPTIPEELATYAFDDDGLAAEKVFLIEEGILKQPLGGLISQARAGTKGTANSRACNWNRPPLDRIANLNLEPGDSSFEDLIAPIEKGVFMKTNCSWSIDDSRNKFQFGCEWGQLIEDGKLTTIVKNPNYRGISENFWRSLSGVGNADTFEVLGTPWCGKAEPNQVITVGHASPICRFSDIDVFGGE